MQTCSQSLQETQFLSITSAILTGSRGSAPGRGESLSASNGQTWMQNSQPVQSSSITFAFGISRGMIRFTISSCGSLIASKGQ